VTRTCPTCGAEVADDSKPLVVKTSTAADLSEGCAKWALILFVLGLAAAVAMKMTGS
jgi:hypothetical protein